jgi:hypothetical protein
MTEKTRATASVAIFNNLRSRRTDSYIRTPSGHKVHPDVWHRTLSTYGSGKNKAGLESLLLEVNDYLDALASMYLTDRANEAKPEIRLKPMQPVTLEVKRAAPPQTPPVEVQSDRFASFLSTGDTEFIKPSDVAHNVFVTKYKSYSFVHVTQVFGRIVHGNRITAQRQLYTKTLGASLNPMSPGCYVLVDNGKEITKVYPVAKEMANPLSQLLAQLFREDTRAAA